MPELQRAEDEALRLVAERACSQARCVAAGVTVVRGDEPALVIGTSLLARQVEQAQWDAGEGPGLDAMRQLQVFNVSCLVTASSWPAFVPLAVSRGVRSSLAVPIISKGRALGALDMYSTDPGAFKGGEQVGLHFAAEAALVLSALAASPGDPVSGAPLPEGPGRSRAVS